MTLWFVFALMTVAAIFAVLWPLSRGASARSRRQRGRRLQGSACRDRSRRRRGPDRRRPRPKPRASKSAAACWRPRTASAICRRGRTSDCAARRRLLALVGLPIAAVAFYLSLGSPQLGDFPLAARTRTADANQPLDNLVAQVEAHLEKNPTDGRGWSVLAPVLARLGRYDDAVRAYRNSITYDGDSAERRVRSRRSPCGCGRRRRHSGGQGRIRTRDRA